MLCRLPTFILIGASYICHLWGARNPNLSVFWNVTFYCGATWRRRGMSIGYRPVNSHVLKGAYLIALAWYAAWRVFHYYGLLTTNAENGTRYDACSPTKTLKPTSQWLSSFYTGCICAVYFAYGCGIIFVFMAMLPMLVLFVLCFCRRLSVVQCRYNAIAIYVTMINVHYNRKKKLTKKAN